ncbi:MAG: spore coat protein CotJB [Lachnospiraceae bacterium]
MNCGQSRLLEEINILDFAVVELVLYLDTHPSDREAMHYFDYYNRMKQEKMREYGEAYGPLTLDQARGGTNEFLWTTQPWPWEGDDE